jgi:hypothetical protein
MRVEFVLADPKMCGELASHRFYSTPKDARVKIAFVAPLIL